jgi:hypothetical protein
MRGPRWFHVRLFTLVVLLLVAWMALTGSATSDRSHILYSLAALVVALFGGGRGGDPTQTRRKH